MANSIKVGVLPWGQRVDWPSLLDVGRRADELGYDSLWTWDHLYPIQGDWRAPIFEGYMTLAGWAGVTSKATLGLMVGANTFRNPALTAKIVTTLDHMSNGRAILGIGGAWFEREHVAYGLDFGSGFGERLDWLDEAVEVMHAMVRGKDASARGPRYSTKQVRNDPPPIQDHIPILIGGDGEKKTLHTVAKYADAWNTGGEVEFVRHKDNVLRQWCERVGRDESEIERTLGLGLVIIRDDAAEARKVDAGFRKHHPGYDETPRIGSAEAIAESLVPYVELGFHHIFYDVPAPHDHETLERFVGEVKPMLEQAARSPARP
ncbi:MAG TPA: LLM class flavin-dependent oxidoreductase [Candidatus Limnocylindrales bacterium]|jgi:alkanesulfonate monooxygenase SsuD/methylene tetrahydromethanopterin reductase-like flavin-dependent oxidoreductase (luciferase family)